MEAVSKLFLGKPAHILSKSEIFPFFYYIADSQLNEYNSINYWMLLVIYLKNVDIIPVTRWHVCEAYDNQ